MIRSDFSCERCEDAGRQAAPFEATITPGQTPYCPLCGTKRWVRRLYAAQIASKGVARVVDRLAEPAYEQARVPKEAEKAAARAHPGSPFAARMVPVGGIGRAMQELGVPGGLSYAPGPAGKAEPRPAAPTPELGVVRGARTPTVVAGRDTEYKVTRRRTAGGLEVRGEKA